MKTMTKSGFKPAVAFLLISFISILSAYGADLQKTFTWKNTVNNGAHVIMNNYNCDLTVHVWDKNEAEFHLTIEATGETTEDENRLVTFLDSYKFNSTGNSVNFHNTFWNNRHSTNRKTTLEINGQKDIELTEFSMKGELWIPASNPFELDSKYSKLNMENFKGKLSLDLYNSDLYAGNLTDNATITAKYSDIEFRDIKDLQLDLYNSTFEAGITGNISGITKYSRLVAVNSGKVDADSYNDKYSFEKTGDVIFRAKYSDLKTNIADVVDLECYNGTFIIGETKEVKIDSKYATFEFNKTGKCNITASYNDKFRFIEAGSLVIYDSKYSNYKADKVTGDITESEGYNDKFSISSINEFKTISINGKYLDISLGVLSKADFRLKAAIKYPSFDLDENLLRTKVKILENSDLQYEGIKGTEKEGMPEINVRGYNVSLRIAGVN